MKIPICETCKDFEKCLREEHKTLSGCERHEPDKEKQFTADEVIEIARRVARPALVQEVVDISIPMRIEAKYTPADLILFLTADLSDSSQTAKLFSIYPDLKSSLGSVQSAQQELKKIALGDGSISVLNGFLRYASPYLYFDDHQNLKSATRLWPLLGVVDTDRSVLAGFFVLVAKILLDKQPLKICYSKRKGCQEYFFLNTRGQRAKTCPNRACQKWAERHFNQPKRSAKK
ncbi:MAG: hypothetical protein EXS64_07405 [Candidatus Latescibacteria bacterium]|nr:hypothetical protein [Candidatus Latescibacterota bacterium]